MKALFAILFLAFAAPIFAQADLDTVLSRLNKETVPYISADQLADIKNTGTRLIILDARETNEYNTSHLPGAIHIGYNTFESQSLNELSIDTGSLVVVYCTIGVRSEDIGEQLQELGYSNVRNLKGGIVSWKNSGYEVIDESDQTTQNVHVYGPRWKKWLINGIPTYD